MTKAELKKHLKEMREILGKKIEEFAPLSFQESANDLQDEAEQTAENTWDEERQEQWAERAESIGEISEKFGEIDELMNEVDNLLNDLIENL